MSIPLLRRSSCLYHYSSHFKLGTASTRHHRLQSTVKMSLISDVIKHDHRELEGYYDSIMNSSDKDDRIRYRNAFTWEFARHCIGEELVVYPVLEKSVKGGQQLADNDRAEHQKVDIIRI